jgi:hypothetical protein
MNNSRLKFSLTTTFVSAIVLIVVRISSKETKSSVGFDVNSAIFQKDNHENVRGCFDLLNTDVNYLLKLDLSSIQDTAKYIETVSRLSDELPSFAIDLAIRVGENTINFEGKQIRIYDILCKWWEIHSLESGADEKFDEMCKRVGLGLKIPAHSMYLLAEAVRYREYFPIPSKDEKIVEEIISHFRKTGS